MDGKTRWCHKPDAWINLNGHVWIVNENEWPGDKNGRSWLLTAHDERKRPYENKLDGPSRKRSFRWRLLPFTFVHLKEVRTDSFIWPQMIWDDVKGYLQLKWCLNDLNWPRVTSNESSEASWKQAKPSNTYTIIRLAIFGNTQLVFHTKSWISGKWS